jgi:hypothetical protein
MRFVLPTAAALALTAFAALTLWRGERAPSLTEADARQRVDEAPSRTPRQEAPTSLKASLKAS